MKRRILAIAVALMMLGALPTVTAHAEMDVPVTETVVEEYSYTLSVSSVLGFDGNTAVCESYVNGKINCTKIVATQKLQKKTIWGGWSDVNTWTKTENSNHLSMLGYATVMSSGTYRVRVDATVYSGSNSENVYATSVEKTK